MKHFVSIGWTLSILASIFFIAPNAHAQTYYNKPNKTFNNILKPKPKTTQKTQPRKTYGAQASQTAVQHAARVSDTCLQSWESQPCLKAVSEANLVLAANYGATLQQKGKMKSVDQIKEHCAAATAGSRGEYPAYAMRSAFVECANIIVDISDETGINPDPSQYQILVGAVLCLDKDRRCSYVEEGLSRY